MCRAKSIDHGFGCEFIDCVCICICLLDLFFAVFSCGACLVFFAKLIKFAYVVCLQVSLGDTSSFLATAVHFPFVFFVLWDLIDIYLG